MKVTLISPYENVTVNGIRMLSAVLKTMGVECQTVMLPHEIKGVSSRGAGFRFSYSESALDQVAKVVQGSDLVGLSLMSNYFDNAVQITQHLRRSTHAPIIWGGVHPTVRPEECLEHADLICVGEGEEALRELVQQMSNGNGYAEIRNIWYKRNCEIVRTPLRPLASDLDSYPYPDYDLSAEFVLHQERLQPMSKDLLFYHIRRNFPPQSLLTYPIFLSRGCHYRCAYCANNFLGKIYGREWRVRRRGVSNFLGELKQIRSCFPEIQRIHINDELFVDDVKMVREFCSSYKQANGIPFSISGFHPEIVDEEKIRLLVDAGLVDAQVGIQTGSMRVMHQVYHRACTQKHITQTFEVLHKFTDRIIPRYHLILDNPWETEEDQIETLRMMLRLRRPYRLALFSLVFYPGTELHERARREGLVTNDLTQVYRKFYHELKRTYVNGLFRLFQSPYVPYWLIALLMSAPLRRLNWVWLPERVYRMCSLLGRVGQGARRLLRGDWSPARNAFRKTFGRAKACA